MANLTFTLRTGRRVGVTTLGDPVAERVVVFCHPAPGSSVFDPDPDESANRGVHIVSLDRPGYGSSDPWPFGTWPSIARAADDIAEYVRDMKRFEGPIGVVRPPTIGIAGWSAGGRVALAVAARHPDLVDRVAVIATPAPNEEVPWIPPELQKLSDELGKLPADAALSRLSGMLQGQADAVLAADGEGAVPLDLLGAGPVDEAALRRRGLHDRLGRMLIDAFRQGPVGVAGDILSYTARPWGFDPKDVQAKTLIIAGQADPIAGQPHAAWYQKTIPDARTETVPGVGHLVIAQAWGTVLAHLAPAEEA
jgi:pimeloyl-ACP methyl ester carboxylesterase